MEAGIKRIRASTDTRKARQLSHILEYHSLSLIVLNYT